MDTASIAPAEEPKFSTVTLDEPIVRGGGSPITEVRLRKPDAGSLRGLKLTDILTVDVSAMIQLLPRITEPMLMAPELAAMNISDFIALSNEVALFLPQKGDSMGSQAA